MPELLRLAANAILEWLEARGVRNVELHAPQSGEPLYRSFGFKDPISLELRKVGG